MSRRVRETPHIQLEIGLIKLGRRCLRRVLRDDISRHEGNYQKHECGTHSLNQLHAIDSIRQTIPRASLVEAHPKESSPKSKKYWDLFAAGVTYLVRIDPGARALSSLTEPHPRCGEYRTVTDLRRGAFHETKLSYRHRDSHAP